MSSLAISLLLVSTAAGPAEPDPLFGPAVACSIEADAPVTAPPADLVEPARPAAPEPRSLALAAESRIRLEDPSQLAASVFVQTERLTLPSTSPRARGRLESPGRAWPFALAATADAATTYWALARGGAERNPLLTLGRLDVGMVKIAQFPLLAKAVDFVEARHPRLGRRLRWTTLVFHAVLALNNVRMGHAAAELGLGGRRPVRP